jgi:hypothetical protein
MALRFQSLSPLFTTAANGYEMNTKKVVFVQRTGKDCKAYGAGATVTHALPILAVANYRKNRNSDIGTRGRLSSLDVIHTPTRMLRVKKTGRICSCRSHASVPLWPSFQVRNLCCLGRSTSKNSEVEVIPFVELRRIDVRAQL